MKIPAVAQPSSERGIALIVVLLLMAVLSGLATGFAMNGNIEVQMGTNEVYYAGARAAAEAGLNRAIVEIIANTNTNFLSGTDGAVDSSNAAAAVNADNGSLAFLLGGAGPYSLDADGQYTYDIEILDDDDDTLYETALTSTQVTQMGEDDSAYTNTNDRLILRAIGYGPNGTTVRLARILETVDTVNVSTTTTTTLSDAAIIVNGNFEMNGAITVTGTGGSVHANGNLAKTGSSGTITGNATASGTYTGAAIASGATGGGRPTINVPDIQASNYISLADYKLTSTGAVQTKVAGVWTNCTTAACKGIDWTFSGGTWSTGKTPTAATYYVEGNVTVGPTSGSANRAVSIIATGNIDVNSNQAKLTPASTANNIQFVTDGDLTINASDLDLDASALEGQILVRGQMDAGGNMEFQGRVMVQDKAGAGSTVNDGASRIHGSVKFTYNGTLSDLSTTTTISTSSTTYVNNVSGWMEQ